MLTKQREKEIRDWVSGYPMTSEYGIKHRDIFADLFSEIRELREELDILRDPSDGRCMEIGVLREHAHSLIHNRDAALDVCKRMTEINSKLREKLNVALQHWAAGIDLVFNNIDNDDEARDLEWARYREIRGEE